MKYQVDFDNEVDGENTVLSENELVLLGVTPQIASQDGNVTVAEYEFPDDLDEADLAAALDDCGWCNFSWGQRVDPAPAPM